VDAQAAHAGQDGRHDQPLREVARHGRLRTAQGRAVLPQRDGRRSPAALRRPSAPAAKGLHIKSSTPAPKSHSVAYPAGIDAARLQYLIEVDAHFAEPKTMTLAKQGGGDAGLVSALQALHYIEPQPDGTVAFTPEGLLKVTATDNGASWSVPVAKRQFLRAESIDCSAADQCAITFTWRWDPNDVGKAMQANVAPQIGTARIVGGPGGWVVADVSASDSSW
jgi:hypothetical protein